MSTFTRRLYERVAIVVMGLVAVLVSLILIVVLGVIAWNALPGLSLDYVLTSEVAAEDFGGGIAQAILGTLLLSLCAVALASPLGVGTAIYLSRYARAGPHIDVLRFFIDVLSGTPSIVLGVFGLLFLVIYLKPLTGGFSLLSGSIALAILIMPLIERSTEEAIKTVPGSIEEASFALGATKMDTIVRITLPYAMSGIITGIVLGVGRAAEESAVVMLTAGYTQFMPELGIQANSKLLFGVQLLPFQDLTASLPATVYHAYEFSNMMPMSRGFASALILIVIVMIINLSARVLMSTLKTDRPRRSEPGMFFRVSKLLQPHKDVATVRADCGSPPQASDDGSIKKFIRWFVTDKKR